MDIYKLLKELDSLNLPKDEYAIISSGVLAIHNIREANDLDIIVTDKVWDKLSQGHPVEHLPTTDKISIGNIEILHNWSKEMIEATAPLDEQIKTADIIDGHRFVKLDLVKKFKQKLGREKDLKDIKLIDNYLLTLS